MIEAARTIVPPAWGPHERARDGNPHRQLMAAVLQTAVNDYWDSFCPRSAGHGTLAAGRRCGHARIYILSKDRVWPFSFENLCDALDLDARTLRRALLWGAPVAAAVRPTRPVSIKHVLDWWRGRESPVRVEAREREMEDEGAPPPPEAMPSPSQEPLKPRQPTNGQPGAPCHAGSARPPEGGPQ